MLQELKPPTTPGGRRGSFNPAQEKGELEVSLPALNPLCLLQAGAARKKSLNPGDGEDGRVEVSGGVLLVHSQQHFTLGLLSANEIYFANLSVLLYNVQ